MLASPHQSLHMAPGPSTQCPSHLFWAYMSVHISCTLRGYSPGIPHGFPPLAHSPLTCSHCSPGTLMTIHAYLDHPLKLTHKDPRVSLASKPIPWPDVPCLSLPYAQPTNECSLHTHLPQEYTHRALAHPHPPYILSLNAVPSAHFLTFPYARHTPLVLSPAPVAFCPHTYCTPACIPLAC